jgi:hypothetical protein
VVEIPSPVGMRRFEAIAGSGSAARPCDHSYCLNMPFLRLINTTSRLSERISPENAQSEDPGARWGLVEKDRTDLAEAESAAGS